MAMILVFGNLETILRCFRNFGLLSRIATLIFDEFMGIASMKFSGRNGDWCQSVGVP